MVKKRNKSKRSNLVLYTFLLLVFFLIGFIFFNILQPSNDSEDFTQYVQPERPRWSMQYEFGEEDKEMFPTISNPQYVSVDQASDFLTDEDIVYVLRDKNSLYIYPAAILSFHHIVNDTIGGKPVAVTLCLLSASTAVYDRTVDKKVLSFGVLGTLYNGNLIMFDNETNSYWLQLTGEAIEGMLTRERLLTSANLQSTVWGNIKDQENLNVLPPVRDMKFYREFYGSFLQSPFGMESLGSRKVDQRQEAFSVGLGIEIKDEKAFYPLDKIKTQQIIHDTIGGWGIVVWYDDVLENSRIFRTYLDGETLTFQNTDDGIIDTKTNSIWNTDGVAVSGTMTGKRLIEPIYTPVYWFSWSTFFPDTKMY